MKIKRFIILFSTVLIASLAWYGCEESSEKQTGSFDFGMNPIVDNVLKSAEINHAEVEAALVTVASLEGEIIFDKERVEFYNWGSDFVTEKLKIKVGEYHLTEFMLVDSSGTVIWATPLEGSRLADLVADPLPMFFSISENQTSHLHPQVVNIGNYNPEDFGYVKFHVGFVEKACMMAFFESQCIDWYYPTEDSIIWSDSLSYDDPNTIPYWVPRIAFFAENGELVSESYLNYGENKIMYPKTQIGYHIVVYDCGNSICFNQFVSADELKMYNCYNGDFLHIDCNPQGPEVIITPEDILRPTIDQGVFGQILERIYADSAYTGNQEIHPTVADLYIFSNSVNDSLNFPMEGCFAYPEPTMQPFAIVRSNSSGYFQLPLESGYYKYLVQTPWGYYVDAFISSRMPGEFMVYPGEITQFSILIDINYWLDY